MIAETNGFCVVGLSHRTAPIAVRERFALRGTQLDTWLGELGGSGSVPECIVLSTCNRTECYAAGSSLESLEQALRHALGDISGLGIAAEPYLFAHAGFGAARHLFRVTSGLDSLVVGEPQIQGQVRRAYQLRQKLVGPVLHRLFQSALAAGGRVRDSTAISRGSASIPSAAVGLACKVLGPLDGRAVLVLGTGEMGRLTARCLRQEGVGHVYIGSRSLARAERVARELDGLPLTRREAWSRVRDFDLVITATESDAAFVTPDRLRQRAGSRPTVILDIAVPRNVAPEVAAEPGMFLYNVDDLQRIIDQTRQSRRSELERAEAIIAYHAQRYWAWQQARSAAPLIRTMREAARDLVDLSLQLGRPSGPMDTDREESLRLASRTLLNKILHGPTRALRRLAEQPGSAPDLDGLSELIENPPEAPVYHGTADTGQG